MSGKDTNDSSGGYEPVEDAKFAHDAFGNHGIKLDTSMGCENGHVRSRVSG